MPHVHRLRVRFRDCDQFQHVNNAVYLTYLEEARFAYWAHAFGVQAVRPVDFILADVQVTFRSPAIQGEELAISVAACDLGGKSFGMTYRITEVETGREVAVARSVQVTYDYEAKRSKPLPLAMRQRLAELEGLPAGPPQGPST